MAAAVTVVVAGLTGWASALPGGVPPGRPAAGHRPDVAIVDVRDVAWACAAATTADVVGDLTLSTSGRTVFVGGRATGGYVQAYGPTAGGAPVWNVGGNGDVEALAIISSTLYVGGHFTSIAGQGRFNTKRTWRSSGVSMEWTRSFISAAEVPR